jgi:hypothetical protein
MVLHVDKGYQQEFTEMILRYPYRRLPDLITNRVTAAAGLSYGSSSMRRLSTKSSVWGKNTSLK